MLMFNDINIGNLGLINLIIIVTIIKWLNSILKKLLITTVENVLVPVENPEPVNLASLPPCCPCLSVKKLTLQIFWLHTVKKSCTLILIQ